MQKTKLSPLARTGHDKTSAPAAVTRPLGILAIDPGTRLTGLAHFEGNQFVHGKVKDFGQRYRGPLLRAARALVEREIRLFRPHVLVIEKTFFWRNKDISKLVALSNEIMAVAHEHGLEVVEIGPRPARVLVCGDGNAKKQDVARAVCRYVPELVVHLDQDRYRKTRFWGNLYDAVAVGLAYLIERKKLPPLR